MLRISSKNRLYCEVYANVQLCVLLYIPDVFINIRDVIKSIPYQLEITLLLNIELCVLLNVYDFTIYMLQTMCNIPHSNVYLKIPTLLLSCMPGLRILLIFKYKLIASLRGIFRSYNGYFDWVTHRLFCISSLGMLKYVVFIV